MLRKLIVIVVLMSSIISAKVSIAQAPERTLQEYTPQELVHHFAQQYSVDEHQMLVTMSCESRFDPDTIGDHNTSFGLSQIHLPAHPEVTKQQALDKVFATEFMAKEFAKNNKSIWTCYRLNFKG